MNKPVFWLSLCASLTLSACSYALNNLPGVYKIDIEQGNMINQSMVDQLRPNMTKRQVMYIMGSPMLVDNFHQQRWDYEYANAPSGENRVQKRITLFFTGENLIGIQGDFHPSQLPVAKQANETTIELPKRNLEKSMWEKISDLFGIAPGDSADSSSGRPKD
ncbi:MAG: outer membrane protein assembly factor BamE [Methylococcales bacterium]|nr:outer membrane protein assembly factor BamE [Methylococcales bacterium]